MERENHSSFPAGNHEHTLVVKYSMVENNWPSHPWIGYNLHRYDSLSLCLIPGETEGFGYWCGDTKHFYGGTEMVAGETTEVTLMHHSVRTRLST